MDEDKKKITLKEYIESAQIASGVEKFDVSEFLSGLDAYGAMPEDVSGIVANLYTSAPDRRASLIKQLYTELQAAPGSSEAPNLPQLSTSEEVQSALPVAAVSERRRQAHIDTGAYVIHQHGVRSSELKSVEKNIQWRREVTQQFFAKIQKKRLYESIGVPESEAKKAIEKALEEPIYETNRKKIEKIIAERISNHEVFRQNREEFQGIFEEVASTATVSYAPLSDELTRTAVGAVLENRTLEDVRPVLNTFASVSRQDGHASPLELSAAVKKAKIVASVAAGKPNDLKIDSAAVLSFSTSIRSIQQSPEHKKRVVEKVAVDDYGRSLVESGEVDEFIRRSEKYSAHSLKNKVTGYVAPAYSPDTDAIEYIAAEIRHNPTGLATAEGLYMAKTHASTSHPTHFEFHLPDFSWFIRSGQKQPGLTVAGKTITGGLARELGTQALLKMGFGATSKVVLVGAPVIGWAILLWTTFSGTIKNVANSTVGKLLNGGLGSLRAASGAFGGFVQNALHTKYEDPTAVNATSLAVFAAVAPVVLTMVLVFQTMATHRAQFLPISSGIAPGGPPIDCTQEPDKSGPACNLSKCEVKKPGDCQWPLEKTSGACIIEGPFVGTHSSCGLSGVDFISLDANQAGLFGAKVFTPYAGTVEASVFGYDDYSGKAGSQDGGTYGNHVIVKTEDGGRLMFAHLRNIQTVNSGDSVDSGTVVGFVDSTGYSLGVHLHYEDLGASRTCPRSGADINKYTPFPVPACEGFADCDAKLRAEGHAACLSEMP